MKFSDDQIQQLKDIFSTKDELNKSLAPIKRDLKSIKNTLNMAVGQFDTRINKLEKHTTHPPTKFII